MTNSQKHPYERRAYHHLDCPLIFGTTSVAVRACHLIREPTDLVPTSMVLSPIVNSLGFLNLSLPPRTAKAPPESALLPSKVTASLKLKTAKGKGRSTTKYGSEVNAMYNAKLSKEWRASPDLDADNMSRLALLRGLPEGRQRVCTLPTIYGKYSALFVK